MVTTLPPEFAGVDTGTWAFWAIIGIFAIFYLIMDYLIRRNDRKGK